MVQTTGAYLLQQIEQPGKTISLNSGCFITVTSQDIGCTTNNCKGKKIWKVHTTLKCIQLQSYFSSPNKELLKQVLSNREGVD